MCDHQFMNVKRTASKIFLIGLTIITILLVVGIIYLQNNITRISRNALENLVEKECEGKYHLFYEELEVSLFSSEIVVKKIQLKPDSTTLKKDSTTKNIFTVAIKKLKIDIASLHRLLFNDELIIDGIQIFEPFVTINNIKSRERPKASHEEVEDLYSLISQHLKSLKINRFQLEDGGFEFLKNSFKLEHINLLIENFVLDENSDNKQLFKEEIELTIRNQSFLLPDSIHFLKCDLFHVSTKDSILECSNLTVEPHNRNNREESDQNQLDIFQIHMPSIKIKGVDYLKAYKDKNVHINEMLITEPDVQIENQKINDENKDKKLLDFIFKNIATELNVDHFHLVNGKFSIKLYGSKEEHLIETAYTDIEFFKVHFDSSNYKLDKKDNYFENAHVTIRKQVYNLKDSIHQVSFDKLNINTFDSTLQITGLAIKPHSPVADSLFYIEMEAPDIVLNKVDYIDAIRTKTLKTGILKFERPSISIHQPPTNDTLKLSVDPAYLMESIDNYFQVVRAEKVIVEKGKIQVSDDFGINTFDLTSTGLGRISASSSWSDLADELYMNLGGVWVNKGGVEIKVDQVLIDEPEEITLTNASFSTKNGRGNIEKFTIYHLDPDSLLVKNKLILDSIDAWNPEIDFKIITSNKKNDKIEFPEFLKVVNINNGGANLTIDRFVTIKTSNINARITNDSLLKIQHFSTKNIHYRNSKSNIKIYSQSFQLKNKTTDLKLINTRISATDKSDVAGEIPAIIIKNWNQKRYWEDGSIDVAEVLIKKSELNFIRPKKMSTDNKPWTNVPNVYIDKLIIQHAKTHIDNGSYAIKSPELNLDFRKIIVLNGNIDALIKSEPDFNINAKKLEVKAKNDVVNFEDIKINGNQKTITLKEGTYKNTVNNSSASVKSMDVNELDYVNLYFNNKFIVNAIQMEKPHAHIIVDEHVKAKKGFPIVNINLIKAQDAAFKFEKGNLKHEIDNLNFTIDKLHLDEDSDSRNPLQFVDNLSLTAGPYAYVTSDGLNTFEIKDYAINYAKQEMVLNEVSLTPKYEKVAYSKHIESQRDWIKMYVKNITLSHIDFDYLIETKKLKIGQIEAYNIDMDVYRDKNVPENKKYKALPQTLLRNVNEDIFVDSLVFSADITYEELSEEASIPGHTSFNNLSGTLKNIQAGKKSPVPMVLKATGSLMKAADFRAKVIFDMEKEDDPFHFTGHVGAVQLEDLNPLLVPIVYLKVNEGRNLENNFEFQGNNIYSEGKMYFNYRDLHIQVLNPETLDDSGFGRGLMTFFANTFVIKKHNKPFPYLREGVMFYERDQYKSIFNFWSWSMMSGVINSIGINKTEKERDKFLEE